MKRHQLIAIATIVLVACVDGGRSSGPSFAISDATHGDADRNAFFFWLPPLVPAPSPTGDFNRFASPIVTVCELVPSGAACAQSAGHPILVAEFSMTSGTDGQVISIAGQEYHVNWHTDVSHLNPDKVYRIAVTVEGRDYGFADVEVGLTAKELKNVDRNEFVPLVDGRTLPIRFRIEAGASCAGREGSCAEAIVDPNVQETVILADDDNVRLAFGDFPVGWTNGPQVVRIERIPDGDFGPGQGPLGTPFPQYPLFFHYFTSAPEPFNLPVRIGVCNVQDDPEQDVFHPPHRGSTVLAMGGEGEFRTLPFAPVSDVLGTTCFGAEREGSQISALPHGLGDVAGRVGLFAASLLAPRKLEASALVVDGGMGGSTEFFSPAGTVDTASSPADLTIHDLSVSPIEPADGEITLSAIVTNSGETDAGPSTISLCASEFTLSGVGSSCNIFEGPPVPAGGSVPLSVPIGTLFPGAYTVTGHVDTLEVVPESDETNNTAVGPTFGVGMITFESYPGGSPTCGNCKVSGDFAARGVTFSFTAVLAPFDTLPHICNSTPNDPPPILIPQLVNHGVTAPAVGDPCNGWLGGETTMTFSPQADTVEFRLRGPDPGSPTAFFSVTAFDGTGAPLPASQILHTIVGTYTPAGPGAVGTRREERVVVINTAGKISRIVVDENASIKFVDNLRIVASTP